MDGIYGRRMTAAAVLIMFIGAVLAFRACPAAAAGEAGSTWGADYFPNIPLVAHDGRSVRFFDDLIKDKVVAINFIYTNCPDACPLETAMLLDVQEILGDRIGRDVFLYSITIDPERDTPEVLRQYAEKFKIGPGWLFLTGKDADITLLRRKLGLLGEGSPSNDLKDHNLSLIIGNQRTGRWMKASPYENPYVLATQIGSWLHNWKMPSKKESDYANAPKVRNISRGESLFRTRCASCHTIGADDPAKPGKRQVGPDLSGVTRKRDRAWLIRWLTEPDKMLAEKEPLAIALLAEYDNVPMPNLRLNAVEIESLIAYIEEESHRLEHLDHSGHDDHRH